MFIVHVSLDALYYDRDKITKYIKKKLKTECCFTVNGIAVVLYNIKDEKKLTKILKKCKVA